MPMAAVEPGVKVAEGGEAERWRLAAFSVGFDVTASGDWHFWLLEVLAWPPSPRGVFWGQVKWMQWFSGRVCR